MSDEFAVGQRWVSSADSQMGLGVIVEIDYRTVSVIFPAVGEERTYAKDNAPLIRARFAPSDTLALQDGSTASVTAVEEKDGVMVYTSVKEDGTTADVDEIDLSHFLQLNRAADRLFYGQIDHDKWFRLRYETLKLRDRLSHTPLYGLTGCRTSLIPHQLYIAREVASRHAPRVLLADEVGLGKTIEAGLILHYQLITERAKRVLIVVPESLVHQWLVEMLRRFNLSFSVFDEERCQSLEQSSGQDNPFHTSQLVLCSLDFLLEQPARHAQAVNGDWDLLVVDEAHHLSWSPDNVSDEYLTIESLAQNTSGLLLLTATPEQLGRSGHFARLRLLDAHRFPDYDAFIREEEKYAPVANAVEALFNETAPNETTLQTLSEFDPEAGYKSVEELEKLSEAQRLEIIERLLDRHGTGRVLFRNTRSSVSGFPERTVAAFELDMPAEYEAVLASYADAKLSNSQVLLSPELLYQASAGAEADDDNDEQAQTSWTRFDPRIEWLEQTLKENRAHKILVITASAYTALDIAEVLRVRSGLHAAVFHEHMSLVERDRAAAFFADSESGSQVLICSEIGSEGRNFQFAHHLIMFDLPLNPDLLEQRIGRLDRIGQTQTIKIMVPTLTGSAQAAMFRWYNEGLNAFRRICPAGQSVFESVKPALIQSLQQPRDATALNALVEKTSALHDELNEALSKGRDRLLEYNSCRPQKAQALFEQAKASESDSQNIVEDYLDKAYDSFGVNVEPHSQDALILEPGERMHIPFPGLTDDAMTVTYSRDVALANEDMQFVTFEHPMLTGVMEAVTSRETGNTSLVSLKAGSSNAGQLFLETLFVFAAPGVSGLQTNRFLPPTTIRLLLNESGNPLGQKLTFDVINKSAKPVSRELSLKVIKLKQAAIRDLLTRARALAQKNSSGVLEKARTRSTNLLQGEIERLQSLQAVNENVRVDEIAHLQQQLGDLAAVFDAASVRLDAVRLVVTV